MRVCRPRHDIIPFHELPRTFKASKVSFRPGLADILTCAGAITVKVILTCNDVAYSFTTVYRILCMYILLTWCCGHA